jgi:hypothetical protein
MIDSPKPLDVDVVWGIAGCEKCRVRDIVGAVVSGCEPDEMEALSITIGRGIRAAWEIAALAFPRVEPPAARRLGEIVGAEVPFFRDVKAFVAWPPPKIEARGVMHRQIISRGQADRSGRSPGPMSAQRDFASMSNGG